MIIYINIPSLPNQNSATQIRKLKNEWQHLTFPLANTFRKATTVQKMAEM